MHCGGKRDVTTSQVVAGHMHMQGTTNYKAMDLYFGPNAPLHSAALQASCIQLTLTGRNISDLNPIGTGVNW